MQQQIMPRMPPTQTKNFFLFTFGNNEQSNGKGFFFVISVLYLNFFLHSSILSLTSENLSSEGRKRIVSAILSRRKE